MKKQLEELLDLFHSDLITKEEYDAQRQKILENGFFEHDNVSHHKKPTPEEIEDLIKLRQFKKAFKLIQEDLYNFDENQVLIWYTCIEYKLGALSEFTETHLSPKILKKIKRDERISQIDLSNEPIFKSFYENLIFENSISKPLSPFFRKSRIIWIIIIGFLASAWYFWPFPSLTPVESVNLSTNQVSLRVGEVLQLHATVLPADADFDGFTWSSANTSIVTVNQT